MMEKPITASFLFITLQFQLLLAFASTGPAFLWSSYRDHQSSDNRMDVVNYQTITSRDLVKSILSEGGWSNILCSEKKQQPVDLALVFVGRELLSSDIPTSKNVDPALRNLLKVSFTKSNYSLAFPYVAASEEETVENSFVSSFAETCGQDSGINNIAFSESCFVEGDNFQKLANVHAVHDYLVSKMEKRSNGQADLVVFCHGNSNPAKGHEQPQTEGEILSELISSVETLGAKYEVLYISDPFRTIQFPFHRELERFLAESSARNGSLNSTHCDEVCKIKSSLLEGVLVGIVLLIILISGLCCMMGIDTPTKFETPQDS